MRQITGEVIPFLFKLATCSSPTTILDAKTANKLYQKLKKSLPDAKSELYYNNHFELLLAVILSAQATDKSVNKVTEQLFKQYKTPQDFLECGEIRLRNLIKTIGLAPTKATNIIKTCQLLLEEYEGKVPSTRIALERLPGVGRKTANVVLNEGFGQATIAVDTHVFRVSNRTGLAPGKTVLETEKKLLENTPTQWLASAHRYLILHGRYVCTARNFNCKECSISEECQFDAKSLD